MTPTAKLRWLELPLGAERNGAVSSWNGISVRVLQQWWAVERNGQITPTGEWRDIPIEEQA